VKSNNTEKRIRILIGTVVSDKMDKTVVVEVKRIKTHPVYKKQYQVSKKYKAHDEKNEFETGDEVQIVETRPVSKTKTWKVEKIKETK
jgi:small subunit ribosomal protein S17